MMSRAVVLLLLSFSFACAVPLPPPRETRFYNADNPAELSRIVNGSAADGCRMIQVVPWKESFIAVMDCPRAAAPSTPTCAPGQHCPLNGGG